MRLHNLFALMNRQEESAFSALLLPHRTAPQDTSSLKANSYRHMIKCRVTHETELLYSNQTLRLTRSSLKHAVCLLG